VRYLEDGVGDLERILPEELTNAAVSSNGELLLPYSEALRAIDVASKHQIAILGVELFEVQPSGLQALGWSDYQFTFTSTNAWNDFVIANNSEAERCIKNCPLGQNHGYILTSTSQNEFASLK
jgi:hypothetical protein